MNKQIKKILAILILIVILPALFFTIFELNSLSNNEKIITDIYESQLDMILFSVNAASEDIISRWGSKTASYHWDNIKKQKNVDILFSDLLKQNKSIKYIYIVPFNKINGFMFYSVDSVYGSVKIKNSIPSFFNKNYKRITNLYSLMKKGYQKLDPVEDSKDNRITHILFISPYSDEPVLCGLAIDSKKFVDNDLSGKIKAAVHQAFIISVFDKRENKIVYSSDLDKTGKYSQSRQIWLLPKYEIAIKLKGFSLQDIAEKRIYENMALLLGLIVLLIIGAVLIIINIRKEMKLAEIKSEFVSNVSHELRTPLALINMFAETLSMGRVKTEEKKQEYYEIISREANRLSNIVNKILNFSQIEAHKRKYNFDLHNVNEIVQKVCNDYKFHLKNKGFTLNCNLADKELYSNCDPEALTEAVINLIDNAVKYSTDKKEITISTGLNGENILVSVEDKGIGISAEDQKRVFEKFFRVGSGLVHNTKGTGLGLTIVKHIIDAHKGTIELESKPGEGSKFILKLKNTQIINR